MPHNSSISRNDAKVLVHSRRLLGNVAYLKSLCTGGQRFCAVVKANAYGHGAAEVVRCLRDAPVDFFAVANLYEAVSIAPLLRQRQSILIFETLNSATIDEHLDLCAQGGFHCTISSTEAVRYLHEKLKGTNKTIMLHANVDTGMGRFGADSASACELIEAVDQSPNLSLRGVYTHFATASEDDLSFAYEQVAGFNRFLEKAGLRARREVIIHAANSAATIRLPQAHYDMVRCGIAMYGGWPPAPAPPGVQLTPVLELQAPLVHVRRLPAGSPVGYGRSFRAKRDTRVAVISLGYADGYRRAFGNSAFVRIRGTLAPVAGAVCMDHFMVDVTDVSGVQVGDWATVVDIDPGSPAGACSLAEIAGTISYEIFTGISPGLRRIVVD